MVDALVWKDSPTCKFSVRSAYWVARSIHGLPSMDKSLLTGVKKLLRSTVTAPKVKSFWWSELNDIIPVTS